LVNLISRNGLISACSYPRAHCAAQALLFQLSDNTLYAPMFLNEAIDHHGHLGTDYTAQYAVEHAHKSPREIR
jgi:hypothetical protein